MRDFESAAAEALFGGKLKQTVAALAAVQYTAHATRALADGRVIAAQYLLACAAITARGDVLPPLPPPSVSEDERVAYACQIVDMAKVQVSDG